MDTIKINDKISYELEINAVIFKREFERYKELYFDTNKEHFLIFAFVTLQIYIEFFLHEHMRRIVHWGFGEHDGFWNTIEKYYIQDKGSQKGKLSIFIDITLSSEEKLRYQPLKDDIIKIFMNITDIRNKILHGHKISEKCDFDGNTILSETKSLLTQQTFSTTIKAANRLCEHWNELVNMILVNCKAKSVIESCKFDHF